MLAPEIWKFSNPPSSLKKSKPHENIFKRQYFNHSVFLVVADTILPPDSLLETLSIDTDYYLIKNLQLTELLDPQFINLFVVTGALTLHSVNNRLDLDDCITINPNGVLFLSLTANTFYQTGLEGKRSKFYPDKFVVRLDLKSDIFTPGSKRLNRINACLKALPTLLFDVNICWEPNAPEICPSSVGLWFRDLKLPVRVCSNKTVRRTHYNMRMPEYSEELYDLLEWSSMVHLECELELEHFSSYRVPSPNIDVGQLITMQWTGMFTAARVCKAATQLESWVKSRQSDAWAMMSVIGVEDSVTNLAEQEHHFYLDGDYSSTIFLHSTKPAQCYVHISNSRQPKGRKRKTRDKIK